MFPIYLRLDGRTVLVAGAGRVGLRKVKKLLKVGAFVRLIEPNPAEAVLELRREGLLEIFSSFNDQLLENVCLVFSATNDHKLNRQIAEAAAQRGLLANIADDPEASSFILPASIDHGIFGIAVTTRGASPALSAIAAKRLKADYGPEYGRLAALLARLRPLVMASGLTGEKREAIFKRLASDEELLARLSASVPPGPEALRVLLRPLLLPLNLGEEFDLSFDQSEEGA